MTLRSYDDNIIVTFPLECKLCQIHIVLIDSLVQNLLTQWKNYRRKLARSSDKKSLDAMGTEEKNQKSYNKLIDKKNIDKRLLLKVP